MPAIVARRALRDLLACLFRVSRTRSTPSSLALFARPALPARGLDWMSPARPGLLRQVRQDGSNLLQSRRTETAVAAILLAKMQREIPGMARRRKSRTQNVTTEDGLPAGPSRRPAGAGEYDGLDRHR